MNPPLLGGRGAVPERLPHQAGYLQRALRHRHPRRPQRPLAYAVVVAVTAAFAAASVAVLLTS